MQNATNRRGALLSLAKATAGVTALGIACSVSQCTAPAHGATISMAPAIDRSAWDRAFAEMEKHRAAADAYEPIYRAALQGFERDKPTGAKINLRPISPIIAPDWRYDLLHREDLDKLHSDFIAAWGKLWGARDPEAFIAEHKACCDAIRQFRREYQSAKDRHNYDAIAERDDALASASYNAQWALLAMPAPDLAALHWKLEHLFAEGAQDGGEGAEPWAQHVMANLMADVRRLMPKEA